MTGRENPWHRQQLLQQVREAAATVYGKGDPEGGEGACKELPRAEGAHSKVLYALLLPQASSGSTCTSRDLRGAAEVPGIRERYACLDAAEPACAC